MCLTFESAPQAAIALIESGIMNMTVEIVPAMGGRVKPVVMCEFEADAERVLGLGFDARMIREYAVD